MIFKDLSKLIKNYPITKNDKDREEFEIQVENLIQKSLDKYPEYSEIYKEENKKYSDSDIKSLKTYVTELIHPSSELYSEKEFPMFKYFNYTKYKSIEDMMKGIPNLKRYPLIDQLVEQSHDLEKLINLQNLEKLEYLPAFNDFTNYMVNHYSFKIGREDARERVLEEEPIYKEEGFHKKFNEFLIAWDHIKKDARKYQCRPIMELKKEFTKKDKLISFLNNAGELYNGMYLAAACGEFINFQNYFLNQIIDANMYEGILHNYVNAIRMKIPVQDAKKDQIVLIKSRFKKNEKYKNLNDIIYDFSERNIFGKNGKINYSDYNSFVYDYDKIEEELGKIILPGVCLFEGDDNLNFVTYWGEVFRGKNSEIIILFNQKYPQQDLGVEEKQNVFNYISNMNKKKSKNNKNDFKYFFASLQLLLFYLIKKGVMNQGEKIVNIINQAPSYLKLSDAFKNFFYEEGKNITLNELMNLFFFFEHLCFRDLAETLQPEYKAKIPEELKNRIIEQFLKQEKKPDDPISVKDLATATRRLISRYLSGTLQVTDFDEKKALSSQLGREEFWDEKIRKSGDTIIMVDHKLKGLNVTLGQAYEFYKIIGEEDRNALKEIK